METKEFLENAVATLKKLDDFNESLVRGTALAQTMRTLRETCFLGNYMRAIANAKTLLKLDSVRDTQAIAMIARSIFELAIEIELIDRIPDSAEKIIAFGEYEHLRRARKIVAYANRSTYPRLTSANGAPHNSLGRSPMHTPPKSPEG